MPIMRPDRLTRVHGRFRPRDRSPPQDVTARQDGTFFARSTLNQMFLPLKRGPELEGRYKADGSLGLGLYIAREITKAHGGEIDARSDNKETVFAVRLPRYRGRS